MITRKQLTAILLLLLVNTSFLFAQKISAKPIANNTKPKIVIGLVIDQMRWDYLYRYQNRYGKNGFNRLLNNGISYENALIPYSPTVTAAGHATIYTGAVPAFHGVVSNAWVDRITGKREYCAADSTVWGVGMNPKNENGHMSPRNMFSTTIGDELKLASGLKSRTFSVALKDRASIFPGGQNCNTAYWLEDSASHWITSSYYVNQLPNWVQQFNAKTYVADYIKQGWNTLYPINTYTQSYKDNNAYEDKLPGEKLPVFPHKLDAKPNSVKAFFYSPHANTYSFQFAKQLLVEEKLGLNGYTDMLSLSISSPDLIGHSFGAQSIEIEDTYLRLDKDIADFLSFLDGKYGTNGYLLFLSADHGVSQIPSYLNEPDVKMNSGILERSKTRENINEWLFKKYAVKKLVSFLSTHEVLIDENELRKNNLQKTEVEDAIVNYLLTQPEVMHAFAYSRFEQAILPEEIKSKFRKHYFYRRSGDVQYILRPQYTDGDGLGADHSSVFSYDSHIPVIFYGNGIKPNKIYREVYMNDIAPTVCAKLQIEAPSGSTGKVLEEVLK
jgi:predicted AlkP superfamily pyrophosphatase or phosphodiesterase